MTIFVISLAFLCEFIDSSMGMGFGTILSPVLLLLGFEALDVSVDDNQFDTLVDEHLVGRRVGIMRSRRHYHAGHPLADKLLEWAHLRIGGSLRRKAEEH